MFVFSGGAGALNSPVAAETAERGRMCHEDLLYAARATVVIPNNISDMITGETYGSIENAYKLSRISSVIERNIVTEGNLQPNRFV